MCRLASTDLKYAGPQAEFRPAARRSKAPNARGLSTRARRIPVERADHHPGRRLDPHEMVFYPLHAAHVLGGNTNALALTLVEDAAPEVHDAVANHHIDQRDGRPVLAFELAQEQRADGGVVDRGRPGLARDAPQRVQQVGAGDDTHELAVVYHGQTLDAVPFHEVDDVIERDISGERLDPGAHTL